MIESVSLRKGRNLLLLLLAMAVMIPFGVSAQNEDGDDSFLEALEECCQQNIVSPLPINRLDAVTLASMGIFTQWQSDIIVNYRKESGSILSAIELAALLGWDTQAAEILENYIDFSIGAQRRSKFESYAYTKGRLWNDWLKERQEKGYVGLPIASNLRFKGYVNTSSGGVWEYGALASNSRGEKFADFCSAFVSYDAGNQWKRQKGVKLLKLVAGDFTAKFGQGLTVWNAKAWNSFCSAAQYGSETYCKRGNVLSGRNTSTEDGLLRGAAASISLFERKALNVHKLLKSEDSKFSSNKIGIASIEFTGFVSYKPHDARIKDGFYTNLLSGGQHSTESLLETKNTVNELVSGLRLELTGSITPNAMADAWNFKFGVNAVAWLLDKFNASFYGKVSVQDYKKYQQFNSSHADFSVDMYLTRRQWIFYSEAAMDAGGNMAFLAGMSSMLADWNISAYMHFYSKSYIAPYSGAVSASGGTSNQRAFAMNVQRNFHYRWTFAMSAGTVYFPWVKYQFPYPSQWNMINASMALKLASSNYGLQLGMKDVRPVENWMRPLKIAMRKYGGTQLKVSLNAVFVLLRTGTNGGGEGSSIGFAAAFAKHFDEPAETSSVTENSAKAAGESNFWRLQCKIRLPLALSLAAGVFHCPDWDGRMYAHGFQLPYSSSNTLLYGNGWHWEGMLKLDSKLWYALGVKHYSYLHRFQIYARINGVNYYNNALNASLGRKNTYEASGGIRFSI